MRAPRDAYPGAQTCCASPTQTPARLANSPGFKSFRCPRWRIKFSLERFSDQSAAHVSESNSRSNVFQICCAFVCVSSRWKVLSGEFRRRPTALAIKFRKPDRVGRRGLSEPREDFSRLLTYAFPRLCPWLYPRLLFHPNFAAPLFDDTNNRRILP